MPVLIVVAGFQMKPMIIEGDGWLGVIGFIMEEVSVYRGGDGPWPFPSVGTQWRGVRGGCGIGAGLCQSLRKAETKNREEAWG